MKNIFIGVDYSINSPGICITDGKGNYHFIGYCVSNEGKSKPKFEYQKTLQGLKDVTLLFQEVNTEKKSYSKSEIVKINKFEANAVRLYALIDEVLKKQFKMTSKEIKEANLHFSIEGYSYGSNNSSSKLDLVAAGALFRRQIIIDPRVVNFEVLAPATIKKFVGYGAFKKAEVINVFNEISKTNKKPKYLFDAIQKCPYDPKKLKPLDDFVDAYFAVEALIGKLEVECGLVV